MVRILLALVSPRESHKLEKLFINQGYRVSLARDSGSVLEMVRQNPPDLVLMDASLPPKGGHALLRGFQESGNRVPVIVLAEGRGTHQAIEAIKLGAFDFLLKPLDEGELLGIVEQGIMASRIMNSPVSLERKDTGPGDALIGSSRPMQEVYKSIGRVAATEATVLIRGESGTGKELAARAVYQHSARSGKAFVVVNCVAIPETLLESELFGYEKGAFTGAVARRIGKIEQAQGGTVFLDEIGDMPMGIQAKILRLLQDRTIERIGGTGPVPVDVRVIAATHQDLEEAMRNGRFREDLYYRLNVVPLNLPPLRQRSEDVPPLAEYFLARHAEGLGVRNPGLTPRALERLKAHNWPGNVRELANAMEQCLIFSRGHMIEDDAVSELVFGGKETRGQTPDETAEVIKKWFLEEMAQGTDSLLSSMTDSLAGTVISEALRLTMGNRTKAAAILGVSRPTLLAKMAKYGLDG